MAEKTLQQKRDEMSAKRYGKPYAWLCRDRKKVIDTLVLALD